MNAFRWIIVLLTSIALSNAHLNLLAQQEEEDEEAAIERWLRGDDLTAWELPGELGEVLPPLPLWDVETVLKAGGGYRENIRRSAFAPEGGSFLLAGFETMLIRLPSEGPRLTVFLETEHLEFSSSDHPADTFISAFSQFSFPSDRGFTFHFGLSAFYLDQVVDLATFDLPLLEPVRVRGYGITPSTSVRWEWPTKFFIEPSASASRQIYRSPLFDHWEYGPKLAAGWSPANSEISFSLQYLERDYDDRQALSVNGESIPDTNVAFQILRPQLELRHAWGENRQWRSHSRFGFEFNRDNETDYFSYDRIRLSQQLGFRHQNWELQGRLAYSFFDYNVQTVEENGPTTRRHSWVFGLETRRRLSESLELFARYEQEWVDSNEREGDYSVSTWAAGLGWKF